MKTNFTNKFLPSKKDSALKITFPTPIVVKEIPARQIKISELTIMSITDSSADKTVTAITKEMGSILLWEGVAYDAAGQWTDADVQARLIELLTK